MFVSQIRQLHDLCYVKYHSIHKNDRHVYADPTMLKILRIQRNNNIIHAPTSLKYTQCNVLLNSHSVASPVHSPHRNNHHQVYILQGKQDTPDHLPHLYSLNQYFNWEKYSSIQHLEHLSSSQTMHLRVHT